MGAEAHITDRHTPAPLLGRLGRYDLLHALASGGMATVYLARAAGIGGFERLVAIKCCHPHLRADDQFAHMFLDEARLAARIHHPNVVATLDVGDDTALYFVMEYVEGVSLAEWLKATNGQGLPPGVALRMMIDVLSGLHAAHELKDADGQSMDLVHRDVSPQNILLGTDGISRIVDFGVAKASQRVTVTRGGEIKGKFGYMPPEQFLGQAVTRKADIYAAGVVLWEALTGRRLFQADSDARVMNLVLQGKIPTLTAEMPGLPPGLDEILGKALARKAEDRYDTAADFAEALEKVGVPLANARDVGALVQRQFAGWIEQRRSLIEQVKTRLSLPPPSRSDVAVREAPTMLARLLDGSVLLVPRRVAVWGAAALALGGAALAVVLWPRATQPPVPTVLSPPALVAAPEIERLPSPAPVDERVAAPEPPHVAEPASLGEPARRSEPARVTPSRARSVAAKSKPARDKRKAAPVRTATAKPRTAAPPAPRPAAAAPETPVKKSGPGEYRPTEL